MNSGEGVSVAFRITELEHLTRSYLLEERFILAHSLKEPSPRWGKHGSRQVWQLWQLPVHMYVDQKSGNKQKVIPGYDPQSPALASHFLQWGFT